LPFSALARNLERGREGSNFVRPLKRSMIRIFRSLPGPHYAALVGRADASTRGTRDTLSLSRGFPLARSTYGACPFARAWSSRRLSRERFFLELTPNPDFDRFPFGVELDPDTKTRS
jgi:hypothetical protein